MIVILAGTITMDPSVRDRYVEIRLGQMQRYRAEPGVLGYTISKDPLDDSVVNVFECYESEEAHAAHQKIHVRNTEIPVQSYNLARYDATSTPMVVS